MRHKSHMPATRLVHAMTAPLCRCRCTVSCGASFVVHRYWGSSSAHMLMAARRPAPTPANWSTAAEAGPPVRPTAAGTEPPVVVACRPAAKASSSTDAGLIRSAPRAAGGV